MRQGAARIPVTVDDSLDDLSSVTELSEAIRARVSRWVVTEARYYASGNVELDAALSLQDLLKPYTIKSAVPMPERLSQPEVTGLLIDARGSRATLEMTQPQRKAPPTPKTGGASTLSIEWSAAQMMAVDAPTNARHARQPRTTASPSNSSVNA